jgi:hypothetical protein
MDLAAGLLMESCTPGIKAGGSRIRSITLFSYIFQERKRSGHSLSSCYLDFLYSGKVVGTLSSSSPPYIFQSDLFVENTDGVGSIVCFNM